MCIKSLENNKENGFALFVDTIKEISKKSRYYIGSEYSIDNIIGDAKLYLTNDELSRFSSYAKKAIEIKKVVLEDSIENLKRILNLPKQETDEIPLGFSAELESSFINNYDGSWSLPISKLPPRENNFPIELAKCIEKYFLRFENSINKLSSKEPQDLQDKTPTLSNPQKIKILDKLNIIGFLQTKGFTKTNAEILLSNLFDISDKQVRTSLNNKKHEDFAEEFIEEIKNKPSIRS